MSWGRGKGNPDGLMAFAPRHEAQNHIQLYVKVRFKLLSLHDNMGVWHKSCNPTGCRSLSFKLGCAAEMTYYLDVVV